MARERTSPGSVMALVAMGLAVIILANDFTALNVALPKIETAFDTDVSTVQWVINAYALVFGVLIVTGGRLADLLGRRRVFFVGATIFVAMSLLAGAAQNEYWLIGARAAMGIGGALMWPAILGMTYKALPPERAGLAGGIILGAAGVGQALGPILGGALTEFLSWRWTLFINLPIGAFAMLVTWLKVHQPREAAEDEGMDYGGIATLSLGLFAVLLALDQSSDWGWGDWRIIAFLVAAVVLVSAFVLIERRMRGSALVPPDVISNGRFAAACITILLMSAPFIAAMLYLPQFMQKILELSPFEAGLGMLPLMVLFAGVSFVAGPLYERLGAKATVAAGTAAFAVGMLLLGLLREDSGYLALVPGMSVLGVGFGLFFASATTAGITALDPARSSLAGGIAYMFQIAGGAVGLGFTTAIFTSASQSKLSEQIEQSGPPLTEAQQDAAHGILAGTDSGRHVLEQFGSRVTEIVRDAFVHGFDRAFRIDALLALAGLGVALVYVGGRLRRRGEPVRAQT